MSRQDLDRVPTSCEPALGISRLILGGAAFTNIYNSSENLRRNTPETTMLFAFRNGINAIDTSPYYMDSQSVIGSIISKPGFQAEFPRETYHILTKCGRYGPSTKDFDYSPDRIKDSVKDSCTQMRTDYLDAVYLHDVEFVAEDPYDFKQGGHEPLADNDATVIKSCGKNLGPGDDKILLAVKTLFQLKEQGVIRRVGISGYPLRTLLRISHLVLAELNRPLDLVLSYACLTIQNNTLNHYLPHFEAAGVAQIISGSPFGMGLLTTRGPPNWHPAPDTLRQVLQDVAQNVKEKFGNSLERLSLLHSLKFPHTVIGVSSVEEVELALNVSEELRSEKNNTQAVLAQEYAKESLKNSGFLDWSWAIKSD